MTRSPGGGRLRRRLLIRTGPVLVTAATATVLLASGGGSASAGTEPEPGFAALSGAGPVGLRLGPPVADAAPGTAPVPTFPAVAPQGSTDWPVAGSVRKLAVSRQGVSAWISRSSQGGVCVLVYDGVPVNGVAAVYAGCSSPEGTARGASVEVSEVPGVPGGTIAAGVVPDGVTTVSEGLADGSTVSSPVSDNAWVRVGGSPAAPGQEPSETRGG